MGGKTEQNARSLTENMFPDVSNSVTSLPSVDMISILFPRLKVDSAKHKEKSSKAQKLGTLSWLNSERNLVSYAYQPCI